MDRFIEWMIELKSSTKIILGTGIFVILYFTYVLCTEGFSLAALASAAISFVIGAVVWGIIILAAMMILDGLCSLGE